MDAGRIAAHREQRLVEVTAWLLQQPQDLEANGIEFPARSVPGAALECQRGLLVLDRPPASELIDDERRRLLGAAPSRLTA
jgi:hypothetical protein